MKLRVTEIVSLDGVMEAPDHWVSPYMDAEIGQDVMSALAETDAMLFGRRTYEEMAAAWPTREGEMAELFNRAPKHVVSSTLTEATWNNSRIINGNIVEEVAKLKAQPGGVLLVQGSADLVRLLARHDLVDEYTLAVAPLFLGAGKRLFDEGGRVPVHLVQSKAYQTGMLWLGYRSPQS